MHDLIPQEIVESKIFFIRGKKVMLDKDLAALYGVETKMLNRAIKRNQERFPDDFMFQLTKDEFQNLRLHFGTSSWGGRRYLPYVFTEHGAIMLANVLNSHGAVEASIQVVRAFVKLRELLSSNKELANKLKQLEGKFEKHDEEIQVIFKAIRQLMALPEKKKRKIGFKRD